MKKLFILLLALLAIAAIAYFCVYKTHVPKIEADIAARTKAALTDKGIASVDVKVDGRDITLSGVAATPKMKQTAEQVAQVKGYNFIDNQIKVGDGDSNNMLGGEPVRGHSLGINLNKDGKITLDGILDDKSHKTIREAAIKRYGEANVTDRVLELDIPVAAGMPEVAMLMIDKIGGLNSAEAMFIKDKIDIKGTSPSKLMLTQVEQQIKAKMPEDYSVNLDLSLGETGTTAAVGLPVIPQPTKPAEKPATQASKRSCQKQFNRILRTSKVRFNSSSAVIKRSSYRTLNNLVATAKKCPGMKIKIHGHTDSTGRNRANIRLSKKRAQAVVNYLAKQGVSNKYLVPVGHGSSKPIASNKTNKGRARNRRIELTVESVK